MAPSWQAGPPPGEASPRKGPGLAADDGTVAWADLQYVVFTLVTLVYFVAQLLAPPQYGLPAVPAALLVPAVADLTGTNLTGAGLTGAELPS